MNKALQSRSLWRKRNALEFFKKVEGEYIRVATSQRDYLESRILYFSTLLVSIVLFSLLFFLFYTKRRIFRPLDDVSEKMQDFLKNRYTYQFSVPSPDEIGNLQTSFNAMAQKVLHQMEELKALDHAKSEFLSIASHELRTPLTSIKGSLSLLQSGVTEKLSEPSLNLVNIATEETNRLIRLINDILDLTKIEAKKLPLSKSWNSLGQIIEDCFKSLDGLAQTTEIQLVKKYILPVDLYVDKDRIHQVITNLLSNAIKYSPKKAQVFINSEFTSENKLRISVKDQGEGLSPEDQEIIFEKFRQATSPEKPIVKGTGLGLTIAKALVEEHGGRIGVESHVGQGCQFYFELDEWRKCQGESQIKKVAA